jgi:hypothetical protein
MDIPILSAIYMPYNTVSLFSALYEISSFDILNSEAITDRIFKRDSFSDTMLEPLNDRLELNSY